MNQDLKIIKKKYGEKMAHLCRSLFPTLLETEGLLASIIASKFNEDRFLYDTIVNNKKEEDFKNFIYSFIDVENNNEIITGKNAYELLDEAGYILYECLTEKEIQAFKKYYAPGEALCTFNGNRLDSCYVFWAVKKNVEEIKRENFSNPTRQDEYGTSVISIQFSKGCSNHLSIKNRYNHTVNNPDSTFSNDLDNIIPGLKYSFEETYNLNINQNNSGFELPNYTRAKDGKFYMYNHEINNIYYCPDNIIIDNGEVKKLDKEKYILMDYFVISLETGKKSIISQWDQFNDSFVDYFDNIARIDVINQDEEKEILVTMENGERVTIRLDKYNQIIGLNNPYLTKVGDRFLGYNKVLKDLIAPQLAVVGEHFLYHNTALTELSLPSLSVAELNFLFSNTKLQELNTPQLTVAGNSFLHSNSSLCYLNLPQLTTTGTNFLVFNNKLKQLNVPELTTFGDNCLVTNKTLQELIAPKLTMVGNGFLKWNEIINKNDILSHPKSL